MKSNIFKRMGAALAYLMVFSVAFFSNSLKAQLPKSLWSVSALGYQSPYFCVDNAGNTFVTGFFDAKTTLGKITLKNPYFSSGFSGACYVAKISADGIVLWAKNLGDSVAGGTVLGSGQLDLQPDNQGGVYTFFRSVFSDQSDSFVMDKFIFKVKHPHTTHNEFPRGIIGHLSSTATFDWLLPIYGSFSYFGRCHNVDTKGNLYANAVMSSDSIDIGKYHFVDNGYQFVALKITPKGTIDWVNRYYTRGGGYVLKMGTAAVDKYGNTLMPLLYTSDSLVLGKTVCRRKPGTNSTALFNIDSSGKLNFVQDTLPECNVYKDDQGNSYLTFYNSYNTDTNVFGFKIPGFYPGYHYHNYLLKCDKSMKGIWIKDFSYKNYPASNGVVSIDGNGNIYILQYTNSVNGDSFDIAGLVYTNYGYYGKHISTASQGNMFITKLNKNGDVQWTQRIGSEKLADISLNPVYFDKYNNLIISTNIKGDTFHVGKKTINFRKNRSEAFVAKLDTSGNVLWEIHSSNGDSTNQVDNLALDPKGNIYIYGNYYSDTVKFNNKLILLGGGFQAYTYVAKFSDTMVSFSTQLNNECPDNTLIIYPNPASSHISIRSKRNIQAVELIDPLGQTISDTQPNAKQVNMPLTNLNSGLYLLRVEVDSKWIIKKILKTTN